MVYGFVRQSDGHLTIESEPGRGTTVTLYFPVTPSIAADAGLRDAPAITAPAGRGERVLLVEDQLQVRLLLKRQLTRLGYSVVDVPDARSALTRLAGSPDVDVLLTDVVLPGGMNGVQLCETALARLPTLGVILTTGYSADMLADRTGAAAAAILPKPVDSDVLARSLRAVLERRAQATRQEPAAAAAQSPDGENM
jgi:DNA-binding NtrC family response regulator